MEQYATSLLVTIVVWAIAFTTRYLEGTWFAFSSLMSLLWAGIISFSMLAAPDFYFSPVAISLIAGFLIMLSIGSLTAERLFVPIVASSKLRLGKPRVDTTKLAIIMLLLSGLGMLAAVQLIVSKGFGLNSLLSVSSYVNMANQLSIDRYTGGSISGIITILLAMGYAGALCGGLLFASTKSPLLRGIALLSILPLLVFTIVYTTRATTLYGLIMFASSNIVGKALQERPKLKLFNRTNIILGLVGLIVIPGLFLVTQIARAGIDGANLEIILKVLHHLRSWFAGNVSGFSVWIDNQFQPEAPNWGLYTFSGIFDLLGIEKRAPGVFKTMVFIEPERINATNIYTLFRFLIADFGIIGTILVMYIIGFFSKVLLMKVLAGDMTGAPILSGIYVIGLWSFVASMVAYNSILVAIAIFTILVYLLSSYQQRKT